MTMTSKKEKNTATWIWYPGDFEIWLGNKFNNRRTERGAMFPPFWKQDSHWATVEFSTTVDLAAPETITIVAEGSYNLMLDGKLQFGMPSSFVIPVGEHHLNIKVHNQQTPPALYIKGNTVKTDEQWLATYEDKIWIDENGVAHGSGIYVPAARWCFDDPEKGPSTFQLSRRSEKAVSTEQVEDGMLVDFGKETFGYLSLKGLEGMGLISIYYGESREEALDKNYCETLDKLVLTDETILSLADNDTQSRTTDYVMPNSKAFRFVYVVPADGITIREIGMEYEYLPFDLTRSGSFECNDDEVNKIWEVGAYTMDLTTREFFMDGIKRDRWTWSGDAIQSYLMNYYLRFDTEAVKRTIRQLRGKDPVTAHVNTIMDYTFYWFKSVLDYYQFTGDIAFVREMYPRMRTLMSYCLGRTNEEGMAEGQPDDWIFVDWVDFPMHKRGILCFEQILFCKSLQTMSTCAAICRDNPLENPPQGSISTEEYQQDAEFYDQLAKSLHDKLKPTFWDEERQAFMHSIEDGQMNTMITKFPNMFAIIYDMVDEKDKQTILDKVMLNEQIEAITTPYMRFYELEALCKMGMQETVLPEIKAYWGGMLREGATTFWEKYIPSESGTQHLSMYGRPYGKSLCHAWGASPIYLMGRYYLGVEPQRPGYQAFTVRPMLGGLQWMRGDVPTPFGKIHVEMDEHHITVVSDGGEGTLCFQGKTYPIPCQQPVTINY